VRLLTSASPILKMFLCRVSFAVFMFLCLVLGGCLCCGCVGQVSEVEQQQVVDSCCSSSWGACGLNALKLAFGSQFLWCDNCFCHYVTMTAVFVSVCFRICFPETGIAENCSTLSLVCTRLSLCDNCFKEIATRWIEEDLGRVGNADALLNC
jgi:hypothetical protein